ncbi:hypothetical protein [Streptomyces sp. URMC 125]|uniref:hypothetical protein n=1 Tax=Streptomyces sp. URMC 125 TaxID=3423419 RepID=UPI003F1BD5AC
MSKDTTVRQLIRRLRTYDPDAVIRLAVNPDFPFAHFLGDLTEAQDEDGRPAVFLGEAGQQGFLPPYVAQTLTWHPLPQAPSRNRRAARAADDSH